jgi:hypothetical protein
MNLIKQDSTAIENKNDPEIIFLKIFINAADL